MRSKDKLGFARKKFASPVSRSQFYSLRKQKEWENSIESPMCNHPYFADKISREEFRRRGIRPLSPFSTPVFRRRWRKISPAKNLFNCSFVPSAKGQTEDEHFQRLDQQNKFLQRRMNVKKLFLCQNFSPAAAK